MSYCITCANRDKDTGKCNYSGMCILKKYNIAPDYAPVVLNSAQKIIKAEVENAAKAASENDAVFNPFQRGNGCTLAGYTAKDILSHTR